MAFLLGSKREKTLFQDDTVRSTRSFKSIPRFFTSTWMIGFIIFALVISTYYLSVGTSVISQASTNISNVLRRPPVTEPSSVYNETLGFQYFYGIVLPGRTDRRDALVGAANATNLTLTVADGVFDKDVPDKDYPKGWKQREGHWAGQLGCLKSHTNIWEKMIAENISSALIIESDSDWDMRIKHSVHGFSEGVRAIANFQTPSENPIHEVGESSQERLQHPKDYARNRSQEGPYGRNWDVLYLGHCHSKQMGYNGRIYAYHDPAAAPHNRCTENGPDPKQFPREGTTRLVYQPGDAGCTVAYAVSNRGARKLMAKYFNGESEIFAVDMTMQNALKDPDLTVVSTFPPIIAQAPSKSNMGNMGGEAGKNQAEKVQPAGGIQISARVNADRSLAGLSPDKWKKEWEDD